MDHYDIPAGVDADPDEPEYNIPVVVKCPHCPRTFEGPRGNVEDELFLHLWKVHEEETLEYILNNMYLPDEIREKIFGDLGPDYVSWIVDTEGEIQDEK
jgi:hypothetical protein